MFANELRQVGGFQSPCTLFSSINNTVRHNILVKEILLNVVLSTHKPNIIFALLTCFIVTPVSIFQSMSNAYYRRPVVIVKC
jgi:hypothetical protein